MNRQPEHGPLSPAALALIEGDRRTAGPSADERARIWQQTERTLAAAAAVASVATIGKGVSATASTSATATAGQAVLAKLATSLTAAKLVLALAATTAVTGATVAVVRRLGQQAPVAAPVAPSRAHSRASVSRPPAPSTVAPTLAGPTAITPPVAAPAAVSPLAVAPPPAARPIVAAPAGAHPARAVVAPANHRTVADQPLFAARRGRTTGGEGGPHLERLLLDEALAAVKARDLATAAALLDHHAAEYPEGRLTEEREALRVSVREARGDHAGAVEAARRFRMRFPGSVFRPTVDAVAP